MNGSVVEKGNHAHVDIASATCCSVDGGEGGKRVSFFFCQ
jgi:hypothetical protein